MRDAKIQRQHMAMPQPCERREAEGGFVCKNAFTAVSFDAEESRPRVAATGFMLHRDITMSTQSGHADGEIFTTHDIVAGASGTSPCRPVQPQSPWRKAITLFTRHGIGPRTSAPSAPPRMTALPIVISPPAPEAKKSNARHDNCADIAMSPSPHCPL